MQEHCFNIAEDTLVEWHLAVLIWSQISNHRARGVLPSSLPRCNEVSVVAKQDTGEYYEQKVDDDEKHPNSLDMVLLIRIFG